MQARRATLACAATALVLGWAVVSQVPFVERLAAQELRAEAGPLEQAARPVTPDNPVPPRVAMVVAPYPAEAAASGLTMVVTLRIVVDDGGRVAEISGARILSSPPPDPPPDLAAMEQAFVRAAVEAVRGWRYEPPADAPIVLAVTFTFVPGQTEAFAAQSAPGLSAGTVPESAPPARRLESGGPVQPPRIVREVKPSYTADAMRARISGSIVVQARVDPDGRVGHARVVRSLPLLNEEALDAVMRWQFTPATEDGQPVPVLITLHLDFTLR